jgi:hypothetical protein
MRDPRLEDQSRRCLLEVRAATSVLIRHITEAGEVSSAFYYVDRAGAMDHRYSILEAQRAVGQLLDQVLTA